LSTTNPREFLRRYNVCNSLYMLVVTSFVLFTISLQATFELLWKIDRKHLSNCTPHVSCLLPFSFCIVIYGVPYFLSVVLLGEKNRSVHVFRMLSSVRKRGGSSLVDVISLDFKFPFFCYLENFFTNHANSKQKASTCP